MQFQYLKKLYSLVLLFPLTVNAQDITGLWKGTLYNDTTQLTLRYEIGISQEKGKLCRNTSGKPLLHTSNNGSSAAAYTGYHGDALPGANDNCLWKTNFFLGIN